MTIIRAPRPESNYTVIQNVVFNSNLSYRAMGLLTMLLSKPDKAELTVKHLVEKVAGSAKPDGRDAIYSTLNELEDAGYVRKKLLRDEMGRFIGNRYFVCEVVRNG